jgi:SAM-dependent methyltransferase
MPYRHPGRRRQPLTRAFWEHCYRTGNTEWDYQAPVPGLVDFLDEADYQPGTILVPGCGRGHDCRQLARHGFTVTGLDISARAVRDAQRLAAADGLKITYRRGDFLRARGRYDWVFEHTCFCALDPAHRDRYVAALRRVLKPGGRFLGIFYLIRPRVGPPFGTTREELHDRFGPHFRLLEEKLPRSYPHRQGKEWLMLWEKL